MAAERPENADERMVADALQRAYGEPLAPAVFLAGREAIQAAAALAAEDAAADAELVGSALAGAFATPIDADVREQQVAAIRAAAQADNVVPLRRLGQRVGRHAVAAMVAVSTLAGGSGVAAASSGALPGQMLYPVKRAVEQVMLTAVWTPGAEARMQAQLAARRLGEAEELLASGASPQLVEPLLTEYDRHVAIIEELAVTSTAVQVAVLEGKAAALREQTTDAAIDELGVERAITATEPTPTSSPPATTTTEAPKASESESASTEPDPAPTTSTTSDSKTASEPSSTSSGSDSTAPTSTQPAPTTDPSPSPSPTPTSTPSRPEQSEGEDAKAGAPGQSKPKPKPDKTEATPTTNPERTPLSDSEPLDDTGPLADSQERSYSGGG